MIDAIFVHLRRIVHTWLRRPDFWFMTFIAPLVYLFIVNRMFGSLVRQLTGEFELRNAVILVVTAWAFILAITGSSTVFVERSNGLHERLITMPAPYAAVPTARIIAEFIRIMAMTIVVAAVAAGIVVPEPTDDWAADVHATASAMWHGVRAHPAAIPLVLTRRMASATGFAVAGLKAVLEGLALLDEAPEPAEQEGQSGDRKSVV